ncbi:MAG: 2-dehydropantoate 2-reductase [Halopseudomonas sp.]|uniref:2-dehydropantoate 2-reductase n=1 Tax=Halopseudomonas sp. TaxID=2901191 RepID=UPI0030026FB9
MLHVLGAGSLGLLWAARLQQAGLTCQLLLRDASALQAWQDADQQLLFEQAGKPTRLQLDTEIAHSNTCAIENLIVATKAYAAMPAVESVRHRLRPGSQILLLQNGLGAQQQIADAFADQRVLFASVTDGAWRPQQRHLIWAGRGLTLIGDPQRQPPPDWLTQLNDGIHWQWDDDIMAVLWRKLAVNCAINPFTLLFDCNNGAVPERAGSWLEDCIGELQLLLAAQRLPGTDTLHASIHEVIRRTADNSSSMRQDLHARRRTEIDYILGHACREAQRQQIPTPALTRLWLASQQRLREYDLPVD